MKECEQRISFTGDFSLSVTLRKDFVVVIVPSF